MTNCNHFLFSDIFYSSQLGFLVGKKSYGEGGEGGGDFSARICGRKPTPLPFFTTGRDRSTLYQLCGFHQVTRHVLSGCVRWVYERYVASSGHCPVMCYRFHKKQRS